MYVSTWHSACIVAETDSIQFIAAFTLCYLNSPKPKQKLQHGTPLLN